jgi:hypothetical protein
MPRAKRRPLSGNARMQLQKGVLRAFQPGDCLASLAERLHQPQPRIGEAIDSAVFAVRDHWVKGVNADDIARATGYPRPFVVFAMAKTAAISDAHERKRKGRRSRRKCDAWRESSGPPGGQQV